jgi:hypothetical protein
MLANLCKKQDIETFSVSPENFTGEKGCGGKAVTGTGDSCARDLGIGWKVSPPGFPLPTEATWKNFWTSPPVPSACWV